MFMNRQSAIMANPTHGRDPPATLGDSTTQALLQALQGQIHQRLRQEAQEAEVEVSVAVTNFVFAAGLAELPVCIKQNLDGQGTEASPGVEGNAVRSGG